ncbi:MAG: hypothetical protein LBE84_12200 [Planctomycetota bacterium]|jgi:hypothetical protein|nr:hypothetical protein [Planctomycetota bacterium]
MIVKCVQCRRIRVDGRFRLPLPGERLEGRTAEVYCPRCAREMLVRIRAGEFAVEDGVAVHSGAVNA